MALTPTQVGVHAQLNGSDLRLSEVSGVATTAPANIEAQQMQPGEAAYHAPSKTLYIRYVCQSHRDAPWCQAM